MAAQSVGHIAITVSDLERALNFYKMLGFEDAGNRLHLEGEFIETLQGIPGAVLDAAIVSLDGFSLELIKYPSPPGYQHQPLRTSDVGGFHVCLMVDSTDDEYERLKKQGVKFKSEVLSYEGGIRVVYFFDPDGNTLEMISRGNQAA